jgi:hypothetical protein
VVARRRGVKKTDDVVSPLQLVFPQRRGEEVAREIDDTIGTLPGLSGLPS